MVDKASAYFPIVAYRFRYEWLKNDKPLILSERHTFLEEGKGTLKLLRLQTSDEGTYQCRVYNQYGTALTRKIDLRKAVLAQYPTKVIFDAPELPEGTPYTLPCQPTKWHPKPTYSWTLVRTPEDREDTQVNLDRRIQMDEDGKFRHRALLLFWHWSILSCRVCHLPCILVRCFIDGVAILVGRCIRLMISCF